MVDAMVVSMVVMKGHGKAKKVESRCIKVVCWDKMRPKSKKWSVNAQATMHTNIINKLFHRNTQISGE